MLATGLAFSTLSNALVIQAEVSSRDNLYQTDWGHPWDTGPGTIGARPAQVVSNGGSAVNFPLLRFYRSPRAVTSLTLAT